MPGSSLASAVPSLAHAVPSLARTLPSLARAVPSLARTVPKPSDLQPRGTRRPANFLDGWDGMAWSVHFFFAYILETT